VGRRERRHIERITAELESISTDLAALESTLDKPLTGTEATWRRRLRRQLRPLIDGLAQHRTFAESADGVFGEIEVAQGHGHELTTAHRLHRSAVRQAEELFDALGTVVGDLSPDEVRARGRRLGSAIRRHHALHADLVLLVFDQDTGTGD
jgi:hypothetical protein